MHFSRVFAFLLWVALLCSAKAEDRIVISPGSLGWRSSQQDKVLTFVLAGHQFDSIRKDVEAAVRLLGKDREWWDVGPDASYMSAEVFLGTNRFMIHSWYPLFRDSTTVAVSEKRGLVVVSGNAEKRKIEASNSRRYRQIVGVFEKATQTHQSGSVPLKEGAEKAKHR